jgi:hypothetical protein
VVRGLFFYAGLYSDQREKGFPFLQKLGCGEKYGRSDAMYEVILKRFENPDEVRTFEKGKFELVHLGGMTIGRASYEPGWKWSLHVGAAQGLKSCSVEHVGLVISGRATAAMDDGCIIEMKSGDLFYVAPGHDSWVVGGEPYVSLHFLGAADYALHK